MGSDNVDSHEYTEIGPKSENDCDHHHFSSHCDVENVYQICLSLQSRNEINENGSRRDKTGGLVIYNDRKTQDLLIQTEACLLATENEQ